MQLTMGLLAACMAACSQSGPPGVSTAQAAVVAPASAPGSYTPTTSAADAGLAVAIARERTDVAVRKQTLHVQQLLREQEQRREAAVRAQQGSNVRCIGGQKMRRVANGWEQAGEC